MSLMLSSGLSRLAGASSLLVLIAVAEPAAGQSPCDNYVESIPTWCTPMPPIEKWACQADLHHVGAVPNDHLGVSVASGGDWNADGTIDIVIGGGNKLEVADNCDFPDSKYDPVMVSLKGLDAGLAIPACPGAPASPPGTLNFRVRGSQVDNDPSLPDQKQCDRFGWEVAFVGDVANWGVGGIEDGDDIAIGAPLWSSEMVTGREIGSVYLLLGRNWDRGTVVPTEYVGEDLYPNGLTNIIIRGVETGQRFGFAISGPVDVDADGIEDLLVGAPGGPFLPLGTTYPGKVYVFFGATLSAWASAGSSVHFASDADRVIAGLSPHDKFGAALDGLGNLDNHPNLMGHEFAVGAPQYPSHVCAESEDTLFLAFNGPGYLRAYSFDTGTSSVLLRANLLGEDDCYTGTNVDEPRFGWSVSRITVDQVASPRGLAVGAPRFDRKASDQSDVPDAGKVYLYDNSKLADLLAYPPQALSNPPPTVAYDGEYAGNQFGWCLAGGGDANGDGNGDLLIGARLFDNTAGVLPCSCSARGDTVGRLYVLVNWGTSFCLWARYTGEDRRDRLGFSAAWIGDLGGGIGDDIIGCGLAWPFTPATELGRAYIFLH